MKPAALGFRAHSGWAAVVAVAGSMREPVVIDRRRVVLADPELPGSKQPYHAAKDLGLERAGQLVKRCKDASRSLARQRIGSLIGALRNQGYDTLAGGILLGSGRPLGGLEQILTSHALIHTAEGEMFRDALRHASEHLGLAVTGVKERDLLERAGADARRIHDLGKVIGPPWTQDEKYAALAGLLALAAARR